MVSIQSRNHPSNQIGIILPNILLHPVIPAKNCGSFPRWLCRGFVVSLHSLDTTGCLSGTHEEIHNP